jgi:hypothetical protein
MGFRWSEVQILSPRPTSMSGDRIPGPASSLPPGVRRAKCSLDISLFPPHPLAPTNIHVGRSDSRPGVFPAAGRSAGQMFTGHFALPASPSRPDQHHFRPSHCPRGIVPAARASRLLVVLLLRVSPHAPTHSRGPTLLIGQRGDSTGRGCLCLGGRRSSAGGLFLK